MKQYVVWLIILTGVYSCNNPETSSGGSNEPAAPPLINYAVTATHPHNNTMFTEGLLVHNGSLIESTGSPEDLPATESVITVTNLTTCKTMQKVKLNRNIYFGEGIALCKGRLYQLTYKNKKGFIYNPETFQRIDSFSYSNTEGWGLTSDGTALIMSDGTAALTFLSPDKLQVLRKLTVTNNNVPVTYLNELEYINGFIYANVWQTNTIVKIDPANGKVAGQLDCSSLVREQRFKNPDALELNGIAFDPATNKIYITGKMWQHLYEISFTH